MADKSSENKSKAKKQNKTIKENVTPEDDDPSKDDEDIPDTINAKEKLNPNETYEPKISRFCLPMDFAESILIWKLNSYEVVTPSYPVLLNHTIGVLWYLFEDPENINVLVKADISWALRFLEQINSSRITDTRDLKCMIQYLRNALTWKYANEDENKVEELETTFIENNLLEHPHSHSLSEYDTCLEVQVMLKEEEERLKNIVLPESRCDNKELVRRLRELQNTQPEDRKLETIEQLYSLLDQTI